MSKPLRNQTFSRKARTKTIMRTFILLETVVLYLCLHSTGAVPIGRVAGCGREDPNLSREQRKYCCESFSLDCEESAPESARRATEPPTEAISKRPTTYNKVAQRQPLGSSCNEPYISCGVGLECRLGVCRRVRTWTHLQGLLNRGKAVEAEERMDLEGLEDQDIQKAPSKRPINTEHLIFHGQSVNMEDTAPREFVKSAKDTTISAEQTLRPGSGKTSETESLGFEEDEIAANVADLLAAKLDISLNKSLTHSIREVIAGTLDERAEREDEADRTEQINVDVVTATRNSHTTEGGSNHTCYVPHVQI